MQVVWSFEVGGAEKLAIQIATHVDRRAYAPAICVLAQDGPLRAEMEATGAPVFAVEPDGLPRGVLRVLRVLREFRPDVLHSHNYGAGFYAAVAGRLAGVPVLMTRHGRPKVVAPFPMARAVTSRLTSRFVAVSDDVYRLMMERSGVSPEKVCTVLNGVDLDAFAGQPDAAARGRMGVPAGRFLFGTVGRLGRAKAQDHMVMALRALLDEGLDVHLVLAGEGDQRPVIEAARDELRLRDRVTLIGNCADVPGFLRSIDAFVLSSYTEGIPVALLEAMAAGLPLVSTAVGGIPEVVADGESGLLVEVKRPDLLAAAMGRLVQDAALRVRLGAAARETVRQRFSARRMVEQYCREYDALCLHARK